MIVGMGTDIIEVTRIEESLSRQGQRFLDTLFTAHEQTYCLSKANKYEHLAARFAVKEAFAKARGTGIRDACQWTNMEVHNDDLGKPTLHLLGKLEEIHKHQTLHVSLSHTKHYASATVIIEEL
jgi:holo-[acyl-carrier protein] synthase